MDEQITALQSALVRRYVIERELGHGGTATVYLAQDLKHGRLVALKVLRPELAAAAISAERFHREIGILAKLSHPNILKLIDSGEAAGLLYCVTHYVDGETLRHRLTREGQLPLADVLQITGEVAEALGYAHQHDVVHRDIKPENILFEAGHAVVSDFGIARAITEAGGERLTATDIRIGTPAYMSPEQVAGDQRLDGRSDLYSLGCVTYEMLAGEPPYTGRTAQAIMAKRLSDPVPSVRRLREEVPEELDAALRRTLAKAPVDRFATAGQFAQAIAEDKEERTPVVRVKKPRTRLLLATGAAVVGLAVLAVVGEKLLASRDRVDPKRVMVAVFANRTGNSTLDPVGLTAADYITRGLFETGLVEVVDVGVIYVQGRNPSGELTEPRQLARRNGAGIVVSGSYDQAGDSLIFQTTITDVRSGRVVQTLEPVRGPLTRREFALEALRQQVMVGLAGLLDPRLRDLTTPSPYLTQYAAYQAFVAGQNAYWGANPEEAVTDFRRAVKLDTTFFTAAVWLGLSAAQVDQQHGCAVIDSVDRALRLDRDRLPLVDRVNLDVSTTACRGNVEAGLRIVNQAGPALLASHLIQFTRGQLTLWAGRPREAVQILLRLDPERDLGWMPDSEKVWYRVTLALAYHELGDYRNELEVARDFAQRENGLSGMNLENHALAGLGRTSDVLDRLERGSVLPPDPLMGYPLAYLTGGEPVLENPAGRLCYEAALELEAHGHSEAGRQAAELAVSWYRRQPAGEQSHFQYRFILARALQLLGRYDEADSLMERLSTEDPSNVDFLGVLGVLAAQRGDTVDAERIDQRLAGLSRPYLTGWHTYYRAEIAAVRGDLDRAVVLLRDAIFHGAVDGGWHLHSEPAFATLRGYAPFDELLRPKG